jgi:hypothetical protein
LTLRYQVANGYMGRMANQFRQPSAKVNQLKEAVMTAVINKRAGGMIDLGQEDFSETNEEV